MTHAPHEVYKSALKEANLSYGTESLMLLAVTIDVEEEGLFGGQYQERDAPVENVSRLGLLDNVFREFGIRPTLLVSYQAARTARNRELLAEWRDKWDGEIGAHLHHWNTPPIVPLPYPQPADSELMPQDLLAAKLDTLLDSITAMGVNATSFRMGRFNLGPRMLAVLEKSPITTDSSIAPMRKDPAGPDHLIAPTDPYIPDAGRVYAAGNSAIVEVPITVVPVVRQFRSLAGRLDGGTLVSKKTLGWFSKNLASLPAQPMLTGLRRLKAAVELHRRRGGRVLTVYFHSSELMPGGCPKHQTRADVDRFVEKLRQYFSWLRKGVISESVTLAEVGQRYRSPDASSM
ncbi:MAG: hypothetical protein AB1646_18010 [Thermodesulfobacteriota bacterium]